MIDETNCSWPIESVQVILTRIKGPIFSLADMKSAYNQMQHYWLQQYCFKRLFYGPAAFSSFMSSVFKPLIRKNKIITYLNDVFIQDTTTDTLLLTLTQYHIVLESENLKAAPDKSFFFLDSVKILGHHIQNSHIHPLKSKIDGSLKLQPPKNKKKFKTMSVFSPFFHNIYTTNKSFFHLFISNSEIQQILNGLLNDNNLLIESKKNLRTEHSASQLLIQKNFSIFCAMPLTMALEQHSSKIINLEKWT